MSSLSDLEFLLYKAMLDDTIQGTGTQTAPASGTDIATVSLPPGYWEITGMCHLGTGGTPAAADNDNARLRDQTNVQNLVTLPVIAAQNGVPVPVTIRRKITIQSSIVIEAIGAGTASVVYSAFIVARKIADI